MSGVYCMFVLVVTLVCSATGGSGFFGSVELGRGVYDGGICAQCSPVVYHTEHSVLMSIWKLSQKLVLIQNSLVLNMNYINNTINDANMLSNNNEQAYISRVQVINVQIANQINLLLNLVNNFGSDTSKLRQIMYSMLQLQTVLHSSTIKVMDTSNQIINYYGQVNRQILASIDQVTVSLLKTKRVIVQISQSVLVFVSKIDKLISVSNGLPASLKNLADYIADIKQYLISSIRIQQSILPNIQQIIVVQKKQIDIFNRNTKRISLSYNEISEKLKMVPMYIRRYNTVLTQINDDVKIINVAIVSSEQIIKKQSLLAVNILSKIRQVNGIIKNSNESLNRIYIDLQVMLREEETFLLGMNNFVRYIQQQEQKLKVAISTTQRQLSTAIVKVNAIKTGEEKNAASLKTLITIINSDVDGLHGIVKKNSLTASTLSSSVEVLEERMSEILGYIIKLDRQCKEVPTKPPPSRCEGPQYICAKELICASNTKTYNSRCELAKINCIMDTFHRFVHVGPCQPPTTPQPNCGFTCEPLIKPVCANNGKTYSCPCSMKLNACHLRVKLYRVSWGPCQTTTVKPPPLSGCNFACTNFAPVCGSDGVTYTSKCNLLATACQTMKAITKIHDGACTGNQCTGDFVTIGTECYFVQAPKIGATRQTAINDCIKRGAKIATFSSDLNWKAVQQHLISAYMKTSMRSKYYWTAAQFTANKWTWYGTNEVITLMYSWDHSHSSAGSSGMCGILSGDDLFRLKDLSCAGDANAMFGWICIK